MTVLLYHPSLSSINFNVVHHRRYTEPIFCPSCHEMHEFKTYHLTLDVKGEVEVTEEVYERLAELEGLPLKKRGKVKPHDLVLGLPVAGTNGHQPTPHVMFSPMKEE